MPSTPRPSSHSARSRFHQVGDRRCSRDRPGRHGPKLVSTVTRAVCSSSRGARGDGGTHYRVRRVEGEEADADCATWATARVTVSAKIVTLQVEEDLLALPAAVDRTSSKPAAAIQLHDRPCRRKSAVRCGGPGRARRRSRLHVEGDVCIGLLLVIMRPDGFRPRGSTRPIRLGASGSLHKFLGVAPAGD